MYREYLLYKKRLEQTLNTVRAEFMGQNESMTEYISDSTGMPPEVRADQIAQQLIIQLTQTTDMSDQEICDSWRWLRAAALFLLERCPTTDHTFGKLITLAQTDSEILEQLNFPGWPDHYSRTLTHPPHVVKKGLDAAIWILTKPDVSQLTRLDEVVLQLL